jgi:hypothetical protein
VFPFVLTRVASKHVVHLAGFVVHQLVCKARARLDLVHFRPIPCARGACGWVGGWVGGQEVGSRRSCHASVRCAPLTQALQHFVCALMCVAACEQTRSSCCTKREEKSAHVVQEKSTGITHVVYGEKREEHRHHTRGVSLWREEERAYASRTLRRRCRSRTRSTMSCE